MDHLRQIEEDLRNVHAESRKKYPEVAEAADQALDSLKAIREAYVNELRRTDSKDIKLMQVSDLSSPYILLCNHVDCPIKVVTMALNGLLALLSFDVVPTVDVPNILRVLQIQVGSRRSEFQAKIIQIILQLASTLTKDRASLCMSTDQGIATMLSILLALCDAKQPQAISSAASGTLRQIIALFFDRTAAVLHCNYCVQEDNVVCVTTSVTVIVRELVQHVHGPHAVRSVGALGQVLEVLTEILENWTQLFSSCADLCATLKDTLIPSVVVLASSIRSDFIANYGKISPVAAHALCHKMVGLVRVLLVRCELETLKTDLQRLMQALFDSVHPIKDFNIKDIENRATVKPRSSSDSESLRSKLEEASSMLLPNGASSLLSKFSFGGVLPNQTSSTAKPNHLNYDKNSFVLTPARFPGEKATSDSPSAKGLVVVHPAICCLEVLAAVVLRTLSQTTQATEQRLGYLAALCECCGSLIVRVLDADVDVRDLEHSFRHSHLQQLLENFMDDGEVHISADVRGTTTLVWAAFRQFADEHTPTIGELLLFTVTVLQLAVKMALRLTLQYKPAASEIESVWLNNMLESSYETVLDACSFILKTCDSVQIQRCAVTILSELVLATSALEIVKPSQITLSFMCKNALPNWPGPEGVEQAQLAAGVKWKHVHIFTRLLQCLHAIADTISDWDCVVDCFDQIATLLSGDSTDTAAGPAAQRFYQVADRTKFVLALDRFKAYSLYLSNDSLIKLMTSFVALSMNNISIFSTGLVGEHRSTSSERTNNSKAVDKDACVCPYSLRAVIDITKKNSFRIASIWQMVLSHLRMVAVSELRARREFAVEAIFEIISSFMTQQRMEGLVEVLQSGEILCDDCQTDEGDPLQLNSKLVDIALPSLDTLFVSRTFHSEHLLRVLDECAHDPKLSQADLLSCLLPMSAGRFDDVRTAILRGLAGFLQGAGQQLETGEQGGWRAVLEVLGSVPLTHTSSVFRTEWIHIVRRYCSVSPVFMDSSTVDESDSPNDDVASEVAEEVPIWSRESLADAFSSTTLIVDEFLEAIFEDFALVQSLLEVLSLFGSQTADTNISLTAVEVLWKVADAAIRSTVFRKQGYSSVGRIMEVMESRLYQLSLDSRPEIRHCAINTLFSALATNGALYTIKQWKLTFESTISPLFEKVGARSQLAMRINEQAVAPEVKKGVKMMVHHSRDTAHKQWSETRTLALRGLLRVLKGIELGAADASAVWQSAAQISRAAMLTSNGEAEVFSAGVDILFSMLKTILEPAKVAPETEAQLVKVARFFWKQISMVAESAFLVLEWAVELLARLTDLWGVVRRNEAVAAANIDCLLAVLVALSYREVTGQSAAVTSTRSAREQVMIADQIRQSITDMLGMLFAGFPVQQVQVQVITSCCEICFGGTRVLSVGEVKYELRVPVPIGREVAEVVGGAVRADSQFATVVTRNYFRWRSRGAVMNYLEFAAEIGSPAALSRLWLATDVQSAICGLNAFVTSISVEGEPCECCRPDEQSVLAMNQLLLESLGVLLGELGQQARLENPAALSDVDLVFFTLAAIVKAGGDVVGDDWLIPQVIALARGILASRGVSLEKKTKLLTLLWLSGGESLVKWRLSPSSLSEAALQALLHVFAALQAVVADIRGGAEGLDASLEHSATVGLVVYLVNILGADWGAIEACAHPQLPELVSRSVACLALVAVAPPTLPSMWISACVALTSQPADLDEPCYQRLLWLAASGSSDLLALLRAETQFAALQEHALPCILFDPAVSCLAQCASPALRVAALELLRSFSVIDLVRALSAENQRLTGQLRDAGAEIMMLKSATTLPF